jgi:hypothetical protein
MLGEATGIAGDLVGMGTNIYQTIEQPYVQGIFGEIGEAISIGKDLTDIGTGLYHTIHDHNVEDIEVETPLFRSLRRTRPTTHRVPREEEPVRRPTSHRQPEEEPRPRMHPLEALKTSTEIISTLGVTGSQLY